MKLRPRAWSDWGWDQELGWKHLGKGGGTGRLLGPREARGVGASALGSWGAPGSSLVFSWPGLGLLLLSECQ